MPIALISSVPWIETKPAVRVMSREEAAWLAGVVDSDGSFGLYTDKKGAKLAIVQVANVCPEFLDHVRKLIGAGSRVNHIPSLSHKGRKPMFNFVLKGCSRCYWVLKQICPFLIIKREKAETILMGLESTPFGARWVNARPSFRLQQSKRAINSWRNPEIRAKRLAGMQAHFSKNKNV